MPNVFHPETKQHDWVKIFIFGLPVRYLSYWEYHIDMYTDIYLQVKVINGDSYKSVYEDVMKQLDKLENEYLPQVKLNKLEVS